MIFAFKLCSPLQIPEDQCRPTTEQTKQKTKLTARWEKCITGSRGDPNWCVGWIMHLSQSFQSCKFAKWQWSKLSLEGMVLRGRLKWLRECKREHQRGREDISVSCQILSWLVLHLHFPSLSLSSYPGNTNRFDNSVWKQLPWCNAATIKTATLWRLHADQSLLSICVCFHSVSSEVWIICGNRTGSIICLSSTVLKKSTHWQPHKHFLHPHTHTHTKIHTHTHSHNRCLVSGVLYL